MKNMNEPFCRLTGSFRDPSGFVFQKDGQLYRRITETGRGDWEFFVSSGLAGELVEKGLLVPFFVEEKEELDLKLKKLPFISYPYEWSFSQLQEAALLTLDIMLASLRKKMILKDASAFNIAFYRGRAVFLDHTSFTRYEENTPWCAYRQFIMHFLNPLVLMQKKDLRLLSLLKNDINGIPLDLTARLLPLRSLQDIDLLLHIHLHGLFEKKYSSGGDMKKSPCVPLKRLTNLLEALKVYIGKLKFPARRSLWGDYSGECSYNPESLKTKKEIVGSFCRRGKFGTLWDLGANRGEFSVIAASYAGEVFAADMDPCAVEELFQKTKKYPNIHALQLDLNNPTPRTGVFNEERGSFFDRCRGDAVLGLALIHHLRITGNWTLEQIVRLFRSAAPCALVEFVPREDPQTRQLLRGREALCPEWELEKVTEAFSKAYRFCLQHPLPGSSRVILELWDPDESVQK